MIGRVNVAGRGEGPAPGPAYSVEKWCKVVGLTYSDISDITEPNMRLLMSKHVSVDYFMEWYNADNSMLDDFTQSEIAMKWIGLNDYVADKLLAIEDAESRLLASKYWEYILKDHVPIMTSNNAPYGEVKSEPSAVNTGYEAYKAFDGDSVSRFGPAASENVRLSYKFTNPICVKRIELQNHPTDASKSINAFKIQYSDDGATWTDLANEWIQNKDKTNAGAKTSYDVANSSHHLCWAIFVDGAISGLGNAFSIAELQFYGRSLNVSVPTMTSNTQPYGEAYISYDIASYAPYYLFDKNDSTVGRSSSSGNDNVCFGYDFGRPMVCKGVRWKSADSSNTPRSKNIRVYGSNTDKYDRSNLLFTSTKVNLLDNLEFFENNEAYRYIFVCADRNISNTAQGFSTLDFFGVDYSDRTERTYLYDHGLKLIPMSMGVKGGGDGLGTITENALSVTCACPDSLYRDQAPYATESLIDIAPYSSVFARYEKGYSVSGKALVRMSVSQTRAIWSSAVGLVYDTLQNAPYGMLFIDASNINDSEYIIVGSMVNSDDGGACSVDFTEIWLE